MTSTRPRLSRLTRRASTSRAYSGRKLTPNWKWTASFAILDELGGAQQRAQAAGRDRRVRAHAVVERVRLRIGRHVDAGEAQRVGAERHLTGDLVRGEQDTAGHQARQGMRVTRGLRFVRMAVPLFDTKTPLQPLRGAIDEAIAGVVDGGHFILGPNVSAFEEEFAAFCGARTPSAWPTAPTRMTLALKALGVGPGDDVVVPSFTFYASAEAIPHTGARPVFCDVDPDTLCVTADTVKAALTPNTKAVIAVHLFGNVAPVAEIAALGVPVIEDAAQAAGSSPPTAGRARSGRSPRGRSSRRRTSAASGTAGR